MIAFSLWPFGSGGAGASSIPGVWPSVVSAITSVPSIFAPWEGNALPYMYTDSKGNVTTGTGNLIDPVGAALALPWKNADGSLADSGTVASQWQAVKDAYPGVQSTSSQSLTSIRLDSDGLGALMSKTVAQFASYLVTKYPNFAQIPADAQLAILSISWAWGPGFSGEWGANGQAFDAAIAAGDFNGAAQAMTAASGHEESINPGIVPRDQGNVQMFANAAANKWHASKLYYPGTAGGIPWMAIALGAVGGVGGFLVGGPIGAAVGAGALVGGGHLVAGGMPSIHVPVPNVPALGLYFSPPDPMAVQTALNNLGYGPLTVDGNIGPKTTAAITQFQTDNGLNATGQLDSATRKALGV